MGILVFHFIARLYIAILYTVDLTYDGIEENMGALFLFSVVSLFFSPIFSHFLSTFYLAKHPSRMTTLRMSS